MNDLEMKTVIEMTGYAVERVRDAKAKHLAAQANAYSTGPDRDSAREALQRNEREFGIFWNHVGRILSLLNKYEAVAGAAEVLLAEMGVTEPGAAARLGDIEQPLALLFDNLYTKWNAATAEFGGQPDAICEPDGISDEQLARLRDQAVQCDV